MHEKALEVFEKFELYCFFTLKEGKSIYPATRKKIRKELELAGVAREFAEQFLFDQFYDMREQIAEQEREEAL